MILSHTRSVLPGISVPPCPSRLLSPPISGWWWMDLQPEGHLHPWDRYQIRSANAAFTAVTRLTLRPSGMDMVVVVVVVGWGVPLEGENCPLHTWRNSAATCSRESRSHKSHTSVWQSEARWCIMFMVSHTLGWAFPCSCYAPINTHARTHVSRKVTWWMCACSRGCLRGAAADRCRRSLWKTLLTNGVSAIHQADYQPSSSTPQPSHVCPPTPNSSPKIVQIHNGSWSFVNELSDLHQPWKWKFWLNFPVGLKCLMNAIKPE